MSAALRSDARGGFALAMVVLLLFAVGIAGATAYQVVQAEAEMAVGSEEAGNALDLANAGLQRYLAQSLGPPDTSVYMLGGGTTTVIPRKMATLDNDTDLYLIRSTATVADPRYPSTPAKRVVSQYAKLHKDPLGLLAALSTATTDVQIGLGGVINGFDGSTSANCPRGGGSPVIGVASAATVPIGVPLGVPPYADFGNAMDVVDSAKVRWDVLQDPNQPMGIWDGVWPSFGSLPTDSFPVVRVTNDYVGQFVAGRGVLIVPGTFVIGAGTFFWDGIILSGGIGDLANGLFGALLPSTINGIVVTGLDGGGTATFSVQNTTVRFHRCNVIKAAANLAHLEPLSATWWEGG